MRTMTLIALFTVAAAAQTVTLTGTAVTTGGVDVGVTMTFHEEVGSHASTIVQIGGQSVALKLEAGREHEGMQYYSGTGTLEDGTVVKATLVTSETAPASGGVTFSNPGVGGVAALS